MRLAHLLSPWLRSSKQRPKSPSNRAARSVRPWLETLEDRTLPSVVIATTNNNGHGYAALDFNRSGGYVPPDTCGAAGPSRYVETVNQTVALYGNKATGTPAATAPLSTFWFVTGGLAHADAGSGLSDPIVTYNDQIGRFIVGDQDVNFSTHVSTFDVAVSTTSNPSTLGAADWKFYRLNTTESGYDADYPGNFGYNHDGFVFTLNMFGPSFHVLVVSVNNADLANGVPQAALRVFNNDVNAASLRPAIMHDSAAGDPMWLVSAPSNSSIDVVKMTGVLSTTAGFAHNILSVAPHSAAVNPRNPNGTVITNNMDSRIQKVGEWNHLLVASQTVGVSATEDDAQWYAINVSSGTPIRQDQGRVSAGPNTYIIYPSVDVNASGQIGMTYMKSGTDAANDFMSMYVTGRTAGDAAGTMEAPVVVPAGTGQANYRDFASGGRAGDLSGINVDPVDGSFWAANEFANTEATANWGTAIANFTFGTILTITGTSGDDTITVHNQAGNPANVEVIVNGTSVFTGAWSSLGGIIIAATSGNDTINLVNVATGTPVTVNLGNGSDVVNLQVATGAITLNGGSGTDTLAGPNATSTWQITGTNAGTLNSSITFSGFKNLTGGSAVDTFILSAGAGVTGTLNGGGGANTLNESAYTAAVTVNLQASTATGVGGTFANLQSFTGGSATNTLVGSNAPTTWNLSGSNAGTLTGGFSFSAFQNLTGGTGADTFVFANGAGVDGAIDGSGGINALDYGAYTTSVAVDLTAGTATGAGSVANIQQLRGGAGDDTLNGNAAGTTTFLASPGNDTITGAGGTNTLVGTNAASTWNVTAQNSGTLTFGASTTTFSGIQNLTGGSGTDTFVLSDAVGMDGNIDGGGGANTLDESAYTTAVTVNLAAGTATGVGGLIANLQSFVGAGAGGNTLVGPNGATTWNVTAQNTGTLNGFSFSGFQNLTGGSAQDVFDFANGVGVDGNLDGGGGLNTLFEDRYTTAVAVDLSANTATGVGGTIANLQAFLGGSSGNNTLAGPSANTTWNITTGNNGTLTGGFSFGVFQNLTGGAGDNSFVIGSGAGVTGTITGGGGTNTLDYSAYTSNVIVDLQTGQATATGGEVNIVNLHGANSSGPGLYNLLIGNGGNVLTGGTGRRNILVAGGTASTLIGGTQDDLLIGGTTNYDTEAGLVSWQAIAAYWAGTDSYSTRVNNLENGTGVPLLDATTVTGNGGSNTMTGLGELALIYTDSADTISGFNAGSAPQVIISP